MNPVMLNANVPTIIPDIGRFKRDDDNADNAVQDLSMRVAVQEQALNALLRAFHGLDVEAGGDLYMEVTPDGIQFGLERPIGLGASGDSPPFFILAVDGTDVDIGPGPMVRSRGAALSEFKVWPGDSLANGLPQTADYRIYGLQFNLQQSIGPGNPSNPEINASADHGDCSSVDNCWSDTDQGIKSSNNATGQADNDHFVTIPIGYADQDGILAQWQRDQILLPVYG